MNELRAHSIGDVAAIAELVEDEYLERRLARKGAR